MAAASTSCKGLYLSAAHISMPSRPALRKFLQLGEVRYFYSHKKEDDGIQFTIGNEGDGYTSRWDLATHDELRTRAIDVGVPIYTHNPR